MIRHYYECQRFDLIPIVNQFQPVVNKVIGLRYLKYRYPIVAGEGYKPGLISYLMLCSDGHAVNIMFLLCSYVVRRVLCERPCEDKKIAA